MFCHAAPAAPPGRTLPDARAFAGSTAHPGFKRWKTACSSHASSC